jgi:hypothetical protein
MEKFKESEEQASPLEEDFKRNLESPCKLLGELADLVTPQPSLCALQLLPPQHLISRCSNLQKRWKRTTNLLQALHLLIVTLPLCMCADNFHTPLFFAERYASQLLTF